MEEMAVSKSRIEKQIQILADANPPEISKEIKTSHLKFMIKDKKAQY